MRRPTTRTKTDMEGFRTKTQKIRLYRREVYSCLYKGLPGQVGEWETLGEIKEVRIVPDSEGAYEITAIIEVEAEVIEEDAC